MNRFALTAISLIAAALVSQPGNAVQPRVWHEDASKLAEGDTDGLAITRDGKLFLAPAIRPLHGERTEGAPAHLWALAEDAAGTIYAGTGPDGQLLRFGSSGAGTVLFQAAEPMITALAIATDGTLYAATAPGGKIYKIDAQGRGELWSETERGYVWDLAFADDGTLHAAAGEPAGILRIGRSGQASDWFECRDAHVVRIVPAGGEWYAATSGSGRVYRIDRDGNGFVLYQGDLTEASDLLVRGDGTVYVSYLNSPDAEPERPAVTINLSDGSTRTAPGAGGEIGGIDEEESGTIRGVIEGLPLDDRRPAGTVRGRLVEIRPDGSSESIWQSTGAAVFSLALDVRDRVLFGTGEPARVYRYDGKDVALLQTLAGAQATGLTRRGGRAVIGTSSPFGLYRFDGAPATGGVFVSRAFDAGATTRWGTIRWETEGQAARAELYTRTGNSTPADESWSAWSPALSISKGSPIVNPEGRYVQWRVRLPSSAGEDVRVGEVEVTYQPYNQPPTLKGLRVEGDPAGVNANARLRWSSYDPDDDPVLVRFEIRRDGEDWTPLERTAAADGIFVSGPRKGWREDQWEWDTTAEPEGLYKLRAHFSDSSSNAPGEGHERLHDRTLDLTIDRTPPTIEIAPESDGFLVTVDDAVSRLQQVEILHGAEIVFTLRPQDGVLDSGQERFFVRRSALSNATPTAFRVRAIDVAGNEAAQELPGS